MTKSTENDPPWKKILETSSRLEKLEESHERHSLRHDNHLIKLENKIDALNEKTTEMFLSIVRQNSLDEINHEKNRGKLHSKIAALSAAVALIVTVITGIVINWVKK